MFILIILTWAYPLFCNQRPIVFQRKWGNISVDEPLDVRPYSFNLAQDCLMSATLCVDFHNKKT